MPVLGDSGYEIIPPDAAIESTALLVVDHYTLDRDYEAGCRAWAERILVIDDLADRPHDCDILMDQTFGRLEGDYKALVPDHCEILAGSKYALLRSQFSDARENALQERKDRDGEINNILMMLGAGDKENVTGFALAALEQLKDKTSVDVIMGANAPHLASVQSQAQGSRHDIKVYSGVEDVASFMAKADLAIGAGGTASWERCCLGLPTLVIEIADNQHKIIQELEAVGAILNAGLYKDLDAVEITEKIKYLSQEPDLVMDMSVKAAKVCDGKGASRLVDQVTRAV
ncbi:MAG: hypothetical protein DHS20C02_05630 [Micavibrio sp.]|nr:MAG: hypothetical protein DHS20C02_05630 [Micavibrio sp.]